MVRSWRCDCQIAVEDLHSEFPAWRELLELAAEIFEVLCRLALVDVGGPRLHDQDFPVRHVEQIDRRPLVVLEGIEAMNLAWVIVAFADRLLHRFHGRDTHPGKLHRTELPLIADLVDREFVPRPMTAGVKEDVDSTQFSLSFSICANRSGVQ